MPSRYIDSVPLLQRSWVVEGFIWQLDRPDSSILPNIPKTLVLVGEHPSGKLLLASESQLSGSNDPDWPLSPWPLQIHNDSASGIPLAFLDESGRYVQLESFNSSLDGENPTDVPTFCRFLCGQTTGAVHVCN